LIGNIPVAGYSTSLHFFNLNLLIMKNFLMLVIAMCLVFGFILSLRGEFVGDAIIVLSAIGAISTLYAMSKKD
jgi:hypothetical protein